MHSFHSLCAVTSGVALLLPQTSFCSFNYCKLPTDNSAGELPESPCVFYLFRHGLTSTLYSPLASRLTPPTWGVEYLLFKRFFFLYLSFLPTLSPSLSLSPLLVVLIEGRAGLHLCLSHSLYLSLVGVFCFFPRWPVRPCRQ